MTLNMKPTQTAFVLGQSSKSYSGTYGFPTLTVKNVQVSGSGYLLFASWYSGDESTATFINCSARITEAGTNPYYGPVWVADGKLDAVFTDCTLENYIGGAAMNVKDGSIVLNNCTLISSEGAALQKTKGTLVLNDCILKGTGKTAGVTYEATKYAVNVKGCTSIEINGNTKIKYTGIYTDALVQPLYCNDDTYTIGKGVKMNCGNTSVYTVADSLQWSESVDEDGYYTVEEKQV